MRADIHYGQEHQSSTHGPDTDVQDQYPSVAHIGLAKHGRSIQIGSINSGGVDPTAEGIGSTSSTHNPRPSSPGPTGMEKGKATGSEMSTDTSTQNPSENTPTHD